MPIEIRELVIRTVVGDKKNPKEGEAPKAADPNERENIINECVDRVMEVLRYKSER